MLQLMGDREYLIMSDSQKIQRELMKDQLIRIEKYNYHLIPLDTMKALLEEVRLYDSAEGFSLKEIL